MKTTTKLLLTLTLFITVTIFPQNKEDYSNEPGYVDLNDLSSFMKGDKLTEINLNSNLLKMLSKIGGEDNQDFKDVVSGLKLIRVNSFGVDAGNEKQVKDKINSIDKNLMNKNWQRIVKVRDHGENTNIYILPSNDYEDFLGLVVATIKDGSKDHESEATFVNIVGKINMNQLGKLGDKFNIPELGNMKKESKDNSKNEKK